MQFPLGRYQGLPLGKPKGSPWYICYTNKEIILVFFVLMTLKFSLPHYFSSRLRSEVKELYVATGIAGIALAAMLIFEPIYLYEAIHFSVPQILLFFAAVYAWYIVLIPLGAKYATAFGLKHALIASVPFQLLYWACLFFARDVPELIWLAPLFYGLEKAFYWPAFHGVVARFANQGQVGREFGMLSSIIQVAQIIGPLLGGIIAQTANSHTLLAVAGAIYSLTIIPLVLHKERGMRRQFKFSSVLELYRTQAKKFIGYWGFGEELLSLTIWPVFLYIVLKGYGDTGVVSTVAAAISSVVSLYIGKLTDGHGKLALLKLGSVLTAVGWFVRPLLPGAKGVLATDTAARVGKNIYFIPLSTVTYERAEATDIMPYVVFFEQSLSVGKLLTALAAAALFALTGSFAVLFVAAGLIALLYLLL